MRRRGPEGCGRRRLLAGALAVVLFLAAGCGGAKQTTTATVTTTATSSTTSTTNVLVELCAQRKAIQAAEQHLNDKLLAALVANSPDVAAIDAQHQATLHQLSDIEARAMKLGEH